MIIAASASMREFSPRSLGIIKMMTAATMGDNAITDRKGKSIESSS
jgi:hypothetical protein